MEQEFESKADYIKIQIEKDFNALNESKLKFFEQIKEDPRSISFLDYYNKTVLDREKIDFRKFKYNWGLQGLTGQELDIFGRDFDKLKEEIKKEKDIEKFFKNHCCPPATIKRQASFCSKLFHTILPAEFPPLDDTIIQKLHLQKDVLNPIKDVLIIKRGYESFIKENKDKIVFVKTFLSKPEFAYLRINESSDIRVIDMYYHFGSFY